MFNRQKKKKNEEYFSNEVFSSILMLFFRSILVNIFSKSKITLNIFHSIFVESEIVR